MVITALEEKENKKFYVPIRGGNRGGWDRFKWENVMYLPYKERELYLGNSAMIGFLDKGGKWRKKNWYLKTEKEFKSSNPKDEMLQAKRKDEQRLRAALGDEAFDSSEGEELNPAELEQLKRKIKLPDEGERGEGSKGLGFDKLKVQIRSRPVIDSSNPYKLEGSGLCDDPPPDPRNQQRQHKKHKKRERSLQKVIKNEEKEVGLVNRAEQPGEKRSQEKRKQKKHKKEKKEKKQKQRKRSRRRSPSNRSRSAEKSHRRRRDSVSPEERRRKERRDRDRSRSRSAHRDRRRSSSRDNKRRSSSRDRRHRKAVHDRSRSRDRRRSPS